MIMLYYSYNKILIIFYKNILLKIRFLHSPHWWLPLVAEIIGTYLNVNVCVNFNTKLTYIPEIMYMATFAGSASTSIDWFNFTHITETKDEHTAFFTKRKGF